MTNLICHKLEILNHQCAGGILSGTCGNIDAAGHLLIITINHKTDVFSLRKCNRFRALGQKRNRLAVLNSINRRLKRGVTLLADLGDGRLDRSADIRRTVGVLRRIENRRNLLVCDSGIELPEKRAAGNVIASDRHFGRGIVSVGAELNSSTTPDIRKSIPCDGQYRRSRIHPESAVAVSKGRIGNRHG